MEQPSSLSRRHFIVAGAGGNLGEQVFNTASQPSCALCHTLAAAGATGAIGPNLDELKPDAERVRMAVRQGPGNMPAFDDTLSDKQIDAVSRYVANAANGQ